MRYYIVDNNGDVIGDSDNRTTAELMLADYLTEHPEAVKDEPEIIEGE